MVIFITVIGIILTTALACIGGLFIGEHMDEFHSGAWVVIITVIGIVSTGAGIDHFKKAETETYNVSKIVHYTAPAPAEEEVLQVWLEKDGEYFYVMVGNKEFQNLNIEGGTVTISNKELDELMTSRR